MDVENPAGKLNGYAAKLIERKARQLLGRYGFCEDDRRDLEQEMVCNLLQRLPGFNPNRAKFNTYIALVVENHVATLIESRSAARRDYRLDAGSLNERISNGDGDETEKTDLIDQEDYLRRTGNWKGPLDERRDLAVDLRRMIDNLPDECRDLCKRLSTDGIRDISRETGKSRASIYRDIGKLRVVFEDSGLRDYL